MSRSIAGRARTLVVVEMVAPPAVEIKEEYEVGDEREVEEQKESLGTATLGTTTACYVQCTGLWWTRIAGNAVYIAAD